MGINATRIFTDYSEWHLLDGKEIDRLYENTTIIKSRQESIRMMREDTPAVVIAGSGMITGGRVLHHVSSRLSDERSTILLVGYQAAGTRGRLLKDGAEELKIHGRYFPIKCKIEQIFGLSAHADQNETLNWLRGFTDPPIRTFINHGEPQASDVLRTKITDTLGWTCSVPRLGETVRL